jgi:hypothetical protein
MSCSAQETTGEQTSPGAKSEFGGVYPTRYLGIWTAIWCLIILASLLPELIPGVTTYMAGGRIDYSECPKVPDPNSYLLRFPLPVVLFEAVTGSIWAFVSYTLQGLFNEILVRRMQASAEQQFRLPFDSSLFVASVTTAVIGFPLFLLTLCQRNFDLVTDDCPTVLSQWVVMEEAIAIPCAFAICSIAAAVLSAKGRRKATAKNAPGAGA